MLCKYTRLGNFNLQTTLAATHIVAFFVLYHSMSAGKLMKRIVTPEHVDYDQNDLVSIAREIHESTYGISSDPLLQFTTVFSALIHDADRK